MTTQISLPSGGRTTRIVALVAAAVLATLAARSALPFTLLKTDPALAWRIDGGNAEAGAALSDKMAVELRGPEDAVRMRAVATDALMQSPLAPQALRNIGFVVARMTGEAAALPILEAAGKASQRDWLTHLWLFDWHYRQGDVARAIGEGEVVLGQQVDRWASMMPLLIETMDDPRVVRPMADVLAARPYWRGTFMAAMGSDTTNLGIKHALMVELKRRGSGPSATEAANYFATADKQLAPAVVRSRWMALFGDRPGASATVSDGGFDGLDLPPPYVWTLYPEGDVYAERQPREDGKGMALYASFERRDLATFATQMLALGAGTYRLSSEALAQDGATPGQFVWRITCGAFNDRVIGALPIRARDDRWTVQSGTFTVPANCPAQQIVLRATGGERVRDMATMWVNSVAIAPVAAR